MESSWRCKNYFRFSGGDIRRISGSTGRGDMWKTIGGITAGLAGAVGLVAAAPVVLTAVGFGSAGVAAGSFAASMMSAAAVANGGGVAAGSLVAVLQSAGAVGLSGGLTAAVAGTGAVVSGAVGAAVGHLLDKDDSDDSDDGDDGDDGDQPPLPLGPNGSQELVEGASSSRGDPGTSDTTKPEGCPPHTKAKQKRVKELRKKMLEMELQLEKLERDEATSEDEDMEDCPLSVQEKALWKPE